MLIFDEVSRTGGVVLNLLVLVVQSSIFLTLIRPVVAVLLQSPLLPIENAMHLPELLSDA